MSNLDNIAGEIVAIRDRWHTKNHPFFRKMLDGSLELRALGQKFPLRWPPFAKGASR